MIKTLKIGLLAGFFLFICGTVGAQIQYRLSPESSSMTVRGTSTLHNWEMKVEKMNSSFTITTGNYLNDLTSGDLIIEVKALKSEHSLMDKKAYEALKESSFPQIRVKLLHAQEEQGKGKATVTLTIAGKTKTVGTSFTVTSSDDGKFEIKGTLPVKMSEFDMEPPVALMGTIKTGDDVQVDYDLVYHK